MSDLRMNEGCSLRIKPAEAYPPEIQAVSREIVSLYTVPEKRKHGWAKKLMDEVCAEADNAGIALLIHVKPYETLDIAEEKVNSDDLLRFYARHGFAVFQRKPEILMCRTPKRVT